MKRLATAILLAALAGAAARIEATPAANETERVESLLELRTWVAPHRQATDPLQRAVYADIDALPARGRVFGIDDDMSSLAARLHLIDNARHTLDLAYYIFSRDTVGYAVLDALCDAVRRGVDVRLVVDSVGSLHPTHAELKALNDCANNAGNMVSTSGVITTHRARVQVVLFNAISNVSGRVRAVARKLANRLRENDKPRISVRLNRRTHDKLLIADGRFAERAAILIGGRNIGGRYFGLDPEGTPNPQSYRDVGLLLLPVQRDDEPHVGEVAAEYFQALFLHTGNKKLSDRAPARALGFYRREQARMREARSRLESLAALSSAAARIESEIAATAYPVRVRLAHELANLTNRAAVTRAFANMIENPNSIMNLLRELADDEDVRRIRVVSPYLFFARFPPRDESPIVDEARALRQWLDADDRRRLEIITNSVLTTDSALAQAIIDLQMAPMLLLPDALLQRWQESLWDGRIDEDLVTSEAWKRAVHNPRIRFLQTGRVDSHHVRGGDTRYGWLHAKFITADDRGFIGTANFDYRSRFLNNEAGFFYDSAGLSVELGETFDKLAAESLAWGSPEWLDMRRALIESGGKRAVTTRWQRAIYGFLHGFYLAWLI